MSKPKFKSKSTASSAAAASPAVAPLRATTQALSAGASHIVADSAGAKPKRAPAMGAPMPPMSMAIASACAIQPVISVPRTAASRSVPTSAAAR